jgi:phage repressor protein C with HTH and peptisase S24 domain
MKENILRDRFIKAFEEIEKLPTYQGKTHFGNSIGVKIGTVTEILGKRQGVTSEILQRLFDVHNVRYEYIFEGEKPIFKGDFPLADTTDNMHVSESNLVYSGSKLPNGSKNGDKALVPFYDVDFAAGSVAFYDDPNQAKVAYKMDIPDFTGCIAFRAYGDSMMPLITSGSMVFATKVDNWSEHLEYGRIYSIVCNDGYKYMKYVRRHRKKPNDLYVLHSENEAYDDFDLKKEAIRNIWLIHGWVMKVV